MKVRKILATLIAVVMVIGMLPTMALAEGETGYNGAALPAGPDMTGTTINVNAANAQYVLDGAYGNINGKTINFTQNVIEVLDLARPTKYQGSGTTGSGSGSEPYSRTLENVTFTASDHVTLAGFYFRPGHIHASNDYSKYNYVEDRAVTSTNDGYYRNSTLTNITFSGLTVTGTDTASPFYFIGSQENATVSGIKFTGCTITSSNDSAINCNNNGTLGYGSITVEKCVITANKIGVYINRVGSGEITLKNNSIFGDTNNAISIWDDSAAGNEGSVTVTGNYLKSNKYTVNLNNFASSQITFTGNAVVAGSRGHLGHYKGNANDNFWAAQGSTPDSNGTMSTTLTAPIADTEAGSGENDITCTSSFDTARVDTTATQWVTLSNSASFAPVAQIGDEQYATLIDAIKAANSDATIEILEGTWGAEAVGEFVNEEWYKAGTGLRLKSLTIKAADDANPVFTSSIYLGYDDSKTVNASMTVEGLHFKNASLTLGEYAVATVRNCTFEGSDASLNEKGKDAVAGALVVIDSCDKTRVGNGDNLTSQVTIENCTINGTAGEDSGIRIRNSGNVTLKNNTVTNVNMNALHIESNNDVDTTPVKTISVESNKVTEWNEDNIAEGGRAVRFALGSLVEGSTVTVNGNYFTKARIGLDEPDFVKITGAGSANVDLSGNYWNNKSLSEVKDHNDLYTSDGSVVTLTSVISNVAQIGTTQYATLADAVAAVPANGTETTITMIADETIVGNAGVTIPTTKNIVLDLNGHTVKNHVTDNASSQVIKNLGTLTIKDAVGTGKITNSLAEGARGGNWSADNWYTNVITNSGVLNLENGSIVQSVETGIAFAIDNNSTTSSATVNIKGGSIYSAWTTVRMFCNSTSYQNVLNMTGGTVENNPEHSTAIWTQMPNANANLATINISNGTLIGGTNAWSDDDDMSHAVLDYSISGGRFKGNVVTNSTSMTGFITGGLYTVAPNAAYIANGYEAVALTQTDEGYIEGYRYKVSKKPVAEVNGVKYTSLAEAIAAANAAAKEANGATVTLLRDYDMEANEPGYGYTTLSHSARKNMIDIESGVIFDLGGNTLSNLFNNTFHVVGDGVVVQNGEMTVGTYTNGAPCSYVLFVEGAEDFVVNDLTTFGGINVSASTATINNLSFSGTTFYAVCSQDGSTVTLNGGTYNKAIAGSANYLFWVQDGSTMNITGGNYRKGTAKFINGVMPVITGGKFDINPSNYTQGNITYNGVATGYVANAIDVNTADYTAGYRFVVERKTVEATSLNEAVKDDENENAIIKVSDEANDILGDNNDNNDNKHVVDAGSTVVVENTETSNDNSYKVKEVTVDPEGSNSTYYVISDDNKSAALSETLITKTVNVKNDDNNSKVSDFVNVPAVLANAVADSQSDENPIDVYNITEMKLDLPQTESAVSNVTAVVPNAIAAIEVHPEATITTTVGETTKVYKYDATNEVTGEYIVPVDLSDYVGRVVSLIHVGKDGTNKGTLKDKFVVTNDNKTVNVTMSSFSYVVVNPETSENIEVYGKISGLQGMLGNANDLYIWFTVGENGGTLDSGYSFDLTLMNSENDGNGRPLTAASSLADYYSSKNTTYFVEYVEAHQESSINPNVENSRDFGRYLISVKAFAKYLNTPVQIRVLDDSSNPVIIRGYKDSYISRFANDQYNSSFEYTMLDYAEAIDARVGTDSKYDGILTALTDYANFMAKFQ